MTGSWSGGFDRGNYRKRTDGEAEGILVATTVEDSAAVRHTAKSLNPKAAPAYRLALYRRWRPNPAKHGVDT